MADPITIMTVASSAMSALGAMQQADAAKQQAQAQQQAADYNAKVKEMQAGIERQQANVREEQQRRKARQVLGRQRTALAQSGTGMGGTALDLEEQSAVLAELDALTIRYEGELRSKGLLESAELDKYEGKAAIVAGNNAAKGYYLSAGASLLSGGAKGYESYKNNS